MQIDESIVFIIKDHPVYTHFSQLLHAALSGTES